MDSNNSSRRLQNITILNWNANGIASQKSVFTAFLARYNVDIACLTETHLTEGEPLKISGYRVYRKDRSTGAAWGGVSIIIKNQLKHIEADNDYEGNVENIALYLQINKTMKLKIISAYKQPNKKLEEADIRSLFNENVPTLLAGDLNSKSTFWGCRNTNPNGQKLSDYAVNNSLTIHSPDEPTHYPYRSDHNPDILDIIVTRNFTTPVHQNVICELNSDHLPVLVTFTTSLLHKQSYPRLINGVVHWKFFQERIDAIYVPPSEVLLSDSQIDIAVENLTQSICDTVKEATLATKRSNRPNSYLPPHHVLNLIKQKSALRRKWQRSRDPAIKNLVNHLTHRIKWEIEHHRMENYSRHIRSLEPNDPGLWKTTKRITGKQEEIPTIFDQGIRYASDEEKCTIFADYLENTFTPKITDARYTDAIAIQNYNERHVPLPTDFTEPTTVEELETFISSLTIKKAPGHDLIPNVVLKHLTKKVLQSLAIIYNACLRLGYFPRQWKVAHILLFQKPGKDKRSLSSYRPISLLSVLSKLLEKVINNRLVNKIEENNIIPSIQYGFRRNHSTIHQLQRITEIIERGYDRKLYTTVALLDVQQAFDKVWLEGLKYKITKCDIPEYLKSIIFSFLKDRSFAVRINNSLSSTKPIRSGVPQGSVLGPILFNIFVSDIPTPTQSKIAMFADDIALITQQDEIQEAVRQLQEEVNQISTWLSKWCITINPRKCQTKIFTLRRIRNPPTIKIDGEEITWNPPDQTVKYLGVNLDTRLTWRQHINIKLNQGYNRLRQLFPIINRKSPLRIDCTILLYKSLLRSLVTYACPVWSTTSKTNKKKLQTFQNKVLRIAVNAPWFIRNEQIHRELNMLTIEEFISKTTKKYLKNIDRCDSARIHELGRKNIHHRLKRKLPQDIFISSDDESE